MEPNFKTACWKAANELLGSSWTGNISIPLEPPSGPPEQSANEVTFSTTAIPCGCFLTKPEESSSSTSAAPKWQDKFHNKSLQTTKWRRNHRTFQRYPALLVLSSSKESKISALSCKTFSRPFGTRLTPTSSSTLVPNASA